MKTASPLSRLQIIGLKFTSSVTRTENWHLIMIRQVSKVLLLLLISYKLSTHLVLGSLCLPAYTPILS